MMDACPVCSAPVSRDVAHCPRCGLPAGFLAVAAALPPHRRTAEERPSRKTSGGGSPATTARTDPNGPAARELTERLQLLRRIGVDTATFSAQVWDVASAEAAGHVEEALDELHALRTEVDRHIAVGFTARGRRLAERRAALAEAGIEMPELPRQRSEGAAGAVTESELDAFEHAESELRGIDADWESLERTFAEVAEIRRLASEAGWDVSSVPDRVEPARAVIRAGRITPAALSSALDAGRTELAALTEALAAPAAAELDRLGVRREDDPLDLVGTNRVRAVRERAQRHLGSSQIRATIRDLRELRGVLEEERWAARRGAAPAEVGGPSPEPNAHEGPVSLATLTEKARGLADRVRSLPPDSDLGRRAAGEFRRATEFLREGRLAEADSTLTRLMLLLGRPEATDRTA